MPHEIDILVGQRIRAVRRVRGVTQTELAEKVGVKFQQVQKYETGMNRVSCSRLVMIAEALEADPSFFIQPKEISTADRPDFADLSGDDIKWLRLGRSMTDAERRAVLNLIEEITESAA